MRRILGIAGLIALGVVTYISVRSLLAGAAHQGSVPSPSVPKGAAQREEPSGSFGVSEGYNGVPRLDPATINYGTGARGGRFSDVLVTGDGTILFLGEGRVYHRDDPGFYTWVVRVRDEGGEDVLFEWPYLEHAFWVDPGDMVYATFGEAVPHRLKPGNYVLQLSIANLLEPNDPFASFGATYPLSVQSFE